MQLPIHLLKKKKARVQEERPPNRSGDPKMPPLPGTQSQEESREASGKSRFPFFLPQSSAVLPLPPTGQTQSKPEVRMP